MQNKTQKHYDWRVCNGVLLQEVILTTITSNLELGAKSDDSAGFFGPSNRFLDVAKIVIKIHGPLVQIAGGNLQEPHPHKEKP